MRTKRWAWFNPSLLRYSGPKSELLLSLVANQGSAVRGFQLSCQATNTSSCGEREYTCKACGNVATRWADSRISTA